MRLEEENRRRAEFGAGGRITGRLCIDAGIESDAVGGGMVGIVGIEVRVGEDELGLMDAIFSDNLCDGFRGGKQRVIAGIEETDVSAEDGGGAGGFRAANFFDALDGHAGLFPSALAFAAFAERKAENTHTIAAARIKSNRATGSPNEIGGMGAEDDDVLGRSVFHVRVPGPEGCRRCEKI